MGIKRIFSLLSLGLLLLACDPPEVEVAVSSVSLSQARTRIVVFVMKDGKVLNTSVCALNENKAYEYETDD